MKFIPGAEWDIFHILAMVKILMTSFPAFSRLFVPKLIVYIKRNSWLIATEYINFIFLRLKQQFSPSLRSIA